MVIHDVRVRNKDGYVDTPANTDISSDDVYNKKAQVDADVGLFYQDDHAADGLGAEPSRNTFVIYDQKQFQAAWEHLSKARALGVEVSPDQIEKIAARAGVKT